MRTDNLNDSIITKIIRRLEDLEANGSLNASSISYGRMRFIGGQLLGQAGAALNWIGSATFNGPFSNTGTFTNTGPFNNSGTFTNTGPFNNSGKLTNTGELEQNGNAKFNGNVEVTQNLDVTAATRLRGVSTLENDLNVIGGGKITAGNVQISPAAAGGGAIIPLSGPLYVGGPGGVRLAEDVEVVASLTAGANVVAGEGLLNPGMGSSTNAAYKQVVVNTANGRLYYRP